MDNFTGSNCHESDKDAAAADLRSKEQIEEENLLLRQTLDELTAVAAANETIWRHFLEIERILFCTRQFDQMVEELLKQIKNRFQIDWVWLYLSHHEILERFFPELPEEGASLMPNTWITPCSKDQLKNLFAESQKPLVCTMESREKLAWLPTATREQIQSAVWIPLTVHECSFGALLVGSQQPDRYQPQDSTDLLEQLGTKIALCMDNCLIYEKLNELNTLDALTGLPNVFQVQILLEKEFRRACQRNIPLSLLLIDLDGFQKLNDQFGRKTATAVLKHVAGVLKAAFDANDVIGRYGSDEFIVVLPNADSEEAKLLAEDFKQLLRRTPYDYQNTALILNTSIATATLTDTMERPHDLLDAASTELYWTKLARSLREL